MKFYALKILLFEEVLDKLILTTEVRVTKPSLGKNLRRRQEGKLIEI